MSLTKFYKNFILCGEADHHCLLCDETFNKVDDIDKHIRWEKHRKAIKTQTCLPKFKNDGIYKVQTMENGFFCQHCNQIFKNIAKVKDHVGTETHISNKTTPTEEPKRIEIKYDTGAIYIGNIKVEVHHWHCVFNKKCFLCNIEVGNVVKHIQSQDHIIRLITTKTKYDNENKCYRKVNDEIYQCFTCKKTFPATHFDTHWQNSDHTNTSPESHKTNGHTEGPVKVYDEAEYYKYLDRELNIKELSNIKDDQYFTVDLTINEVVCKKCNKPVKNTEKCLSNHIYKHSMYHTGESKMMKYIHDQTNKEVVFVYDRDHGKARHEVAIYGRDNYIKMNCGGSKGYCTLCDRYLSANINIFKQHVNGQVHNSHLEIKNELKPRKHKKSPLKMVSLSRYLNIIDWLPDMSSVGVNREVRIDRDSFLLMKEIEHGPHYKKTKCFACDEILARGSDEDHVKTKTHKSNLLAAKVVLLKWSFTREISPKLYHCGLCNVTLPYWDTFEKHITNMSHKMNIVKRHFFNSIENFEKHYGHLPINVEIESSSNNDVLYDNILLGVYSKM